MSGVRRQWHTTVTMRVASTHEEIGTQRRPSVRRPLTVSPLPLSRLSPPTYPTFLDLIPLLLLSPSSPPLKPPQRKEQIAELQSEVAAMRRVRGHSHVVDLHALFEDSEAVHLVLDLCVHGDLYEYLIQRPSLPEHIVADMAR